MYILKYCYFKHDKNFNPIEYPINRQITGDTLKEVMSKYRSERDNHDIAKYTPFYFGEVINTEE